MNTFVTCVIGMIYFILTKDFDKEGNIESLIDAKEGWALFVHTNKIYKKKYIKNRVHF